LGKGGGAYVARAKPEAPLSVENICVSAKNRGGFTGALADLEEHAHAFINEMVYQLLDGFSVQVGGLFSLHARIGGTYSGGRDPIPSDKISIAFRELSHLKALLAKVKVENEGLAGDGAFIDEVTDIKTGALNSGISPGGMFALDGHKIKVAGDSPDCGVYFALEGASPAVRQKVTENLADNTPARIVGIAPALSPGQWRVEVVTQFTGSGTLLKTPRTVVFPSALTVA
ncbi:MAG: DUF4469 domain-containing protein, partial [Treponema sp.]|nr:DUF4469 domain-containing protein [Treponema sp.]